VATVQPTTQFAVATTVATTAGATTQATTKPSKGPSSGMASKNVKEISFEENAEVNSVTLADDGTLLRRTHLTASTVQYDMVSKRMTVPVEGRMLVEDHRPTTQPTAGGSEPQPAGGKVGPENNRGTTAFAWSKRFTYDDGTKHAVMEGDLARPVRVVHRDDAGSKEYQLTGETVTADMEEVAATTQPSTTGAGVQVAAAGSTTTKPTTKPSTKMQMKRVTATGHLLFTGPGAQIRALYMEFDPKTNWLMARGNERELVDFNIASQPGGPKLAEEVNYNTETGQVMAKRPQVRMGR
jgi:hypothetical protein